MYFAHDPDQNFYYLGDEQPNSRTYNRHLVDTNPKAIAIDVETISLKERIAIGVSIAVSPTCAFYFPLFPTESAIVGISRCDLSKCSEEYGLYDRIFEQLEKEKPRHRGNIKDALIGETAIKTGITLVTDDIALRETVKELGGVAIHLRDFLKVTENKC